MWFIGSTTTFIEFDPTNDV